MTLTEEEAEEIHADQQLSPTVVFAIIVVERTPAVPRFGCHSLLIYQTALHLNCLTLLELMKKKREMTTSYLGFSARAVRSSFDTEEERSCETLLLYGKSWSSKVQSLLPVSACLPLQLLTIPHSLLWRGGGSPCKRPSRETTPPAPPPLIRAISYARRSIPTLCVCVEGDAASQLQLGDGVCSDITS